MPCIEVKTTMPLSDSKQDELAKKMAKAMKDVLNKAEDGVMMEFTGNQPIYFHNQRCSHAALLRCSFLRHNPPEMYDTYTGVICDIYQEALDIPAENIYVIYHETDFFGWNGKNL